jgi:hypothetical protein
MSEQSCLLANLSNANVEKEINVTDNNYDNNYRKILYCKI